MTTMEELAVVCHWVENGLPVKHFNEIIPLKKVDAHKTLVDCLKMDGVQISKLIGMGFDGAATFPGNHNGVQTLLKRNSPHSIFVHCHCHLLQLACIQAANSTPACLYHTHYSLEGFSTTHLILLSRMSKRGTASEGELHCHCDDCQHHIRRNTAAISIGN